jgi:tetratricopeptide (TPR) repeat protein
MLTFLRRLGAGRFCLLVLALKFASPTAAAEKWLYARTENFEMFSTETEKKSRRILTELEQFRANFLVSLPPRRAREPRTTVVLFSSDRQFNPYKPLYNGKPKAVAGYCVSGQDEVVIALTTDLDADLEMEPSEVIYHEYVHLLMRARGVVAPLWFNEGMAELYSTFAVNGKEVEFGRPKKIYVNYLNLAPVISLSKLFAVSERSPDYNEDNRAGQFYAQAWAVTHFLLCGADRTNSDKLYRFLDLEEKSPLRTAENFQAAFGMDYRKMEMNLRDYLQGGKYYKRRSTSVLPELTSLAFRPATDFERDLALANLRWRVNDAPDTAARGLELAARQPDSPRPHELLAAVATQAGDYERALACWETAAKLGSDNHYVYAKLALGRLQQRIDALDFNARLSSETAEELRAWLDHALKLNPDSFEAFESLAFVESRAPRFRLEAIREIQKASYEMRDASATLLALAVVRWRVRDYPTCNSIIEALLSSGRTPLETRIAARALRTHIAGFAGGSAAAESSSGMSTPQTVPARN